MAPTNLPNEMLYEVISHLGADMVADSGESRQAILACATVCGSFHDLSTPLLYSSIQLWDHEDDQEPEQSAARKLLRSLEHNTKLCGYIKTLEIYLNDDSTLPVADKQSGLPNILTLLGNGLKAFILTCHSFACDDDSSVPSRGFDEISPEFHRALDNLLEDGIQRNQSDRKLEELRISRAHNVPNAFLEKCAVSTTSLILEEVENDPYCEFDSSLWNLPNPQLTEQQSLIPPLSKFTYIMMQEVEENDSRSSIFLLRCWSSVKTLEICIPLTKIGMQFVSDAVDAMYSLSIEGGHKLECLIVEMAPFYDDFGDDSDGIGLDDLSWKCFPLLKRIGFTKVDVNAYHTNPLIPFIHKITEKVDLEVIDLDLCIAFPDDGQKNSLGLLLTYPSEQWEQLNENLSDPARFPNLQHLNIAACFTFCSEILYEEYKYQLNEAVCRDLKANLPHLHVDITVSAKLLRMPPSTLAYGENIDYQYHEDEDEFGDDELEDEDESDGESEDEDDEDEN